MATPFNAYDLLRQQIRVNPLDSHIDIRRIAASHCRDPRGAEDFCVSLMLELESLRAELRILRVPARFEKPSITKPTVIPCGEPVTLLL